ncbi:MAG TPA: hypothetical protein VII73_03510 [Caulobacteraceae bacterium]
MRPRVVLGCALFWTLGLATEQARAADAGRFDGKWDVTLVCPGSPDGALLFTFAFSANVENGRLHGENGVAGQPGWMVLDGPIQPDGAAALDARGLTGSAPYNVNQTGRGVAYHHAVTAHFETTRGAGYWVTTRTCDFTFTRR